MGAPRPGRRPEVGARALSTDGRLPLDLGPGAAAPDGADESTELEEGARVVRVLVDEPAIDRVFDYVVPPRWADRVRVGSIVRVDLRGRRVRGWVTEVDVEPPAGIALHPITRVSGLGPPPGIISLARWCAVRWVGRTSHFLRTASPPTVVESVETRRDGPAVVTVTDDLIRAAMGHDADAVVVRLAPTADPVPWAQAVAAAGRALILTPAVADAHHLAAALRRAGITVALMPRDWARAAGGAVTVGARAAAFAPVGPLDAVLVIDEHDEAHQEEAAPTWNARDVAVERARRDGARCILTSPAPSLDTLAWAPLLTPSRAAERAGWPIVDVVDRRADDPATGEWCSPTLARVLGSGRSVACVINRKGRARLPICHQCGEIPRGAGGGPLALEGDDLVDPATGDSRPAVCAACGSTRFRRVRLGVSGVREELERLARRPVAELTGDTDGELADVDLYVGTEALLHRLDHVDVVAFLDFDQELLAPRYRAAEQAMALLVRAARLTGPRSADGEGGGRLLVQTRLVEHEVLDAARHADPGRLAAALAPRREALRLPPQVALATVSGPAADAFVAGLDHDRVEVIGPDDGVHLVRAVDHDVLSEVLRAAPRPPGRLRIAVDPLRA